MFTPVLGPSVLKCRNPQPGFRSAASPGPLHSLCPPPTFSRPGHVCPCFPSKPISAVPWRRHDLKAPKVRMELPTFRKNSIQDLLSFPRMGEPRCPGGVLCELQLQLVSGSQAHPKFSGWAWHDHVPVPSPRLQDCPSFKYFFFLIQAIT